MADNDGSYHSLYHPIGNSAQSIEVERSNLEGPILNEIISKGDTGDHTKSTTQIKRLISDVWSHYKKI